MYNRISHINSELEDCAFLFGARQTGKSIFLQKSFPNDIFIDLLDTGIKSRFTKRPTLPQKDNCLSLDPINRQEDGVECMYIMDFLKTMWEVGI